MYIWRDVYKRQVYAFATIRKTAVSMSFVMNTDFMYMMKPTWKATECIMISGKAVHWVTIPNG